MILISSKQQENWQKFINSFRENNKWANHLVRQNIEWSFIPSWAPYFGGLWEAAVKATKRHLYSHERFSLDIWRILLMEIESILNSRPLTSLSSDPNDLSALTPAHFLVEDTLLLPAEHSYQIIADNKLSRWQHVQKLRQHFWERWREEYLQEL